VRGIPPGEIGNTVTNGVTFLLGAAGTMLLMQRVIPTGDPWRITGCAIFSAALLAVYGVSTLSHAVSSPRPRHWFRVLDQGFIYLLIVGTYTPFAFTYLRSPGWLLFLALMWGIALWGLVAKLMFAHRIDSASVTSYIVLGWMSVVPLVALVGTLPVGGLGWIIAGGLCYTCGTVFFTIDNPRYHCHAIWHTLALAGSGCHFAAIYYYVASLPTWITQ
jgi:hemolysin III